MKAQAFGRRLDWQPRAAAVRAALDDALGRLPVRAVPVEAAPDWPTPAAARAGVALGPTAAAALRRLSALVVPAEAAPGWPAPLRLADNGPTAGPRVSTVTVIETAPTAPPATTAIGDTRDAATPQPPLAATAPLGESAASTVRPAPVVAPPTSAPAQTWTKPGMIRAGEDPAVERARSTPAQRIGDEGERLAALRLEALGWRIVARNVRVSRAEVDLLAVDPSDPPTLVVVEVRRRGRRDFGLAEETVDRRKLAMLRRAAGELAARRALPDGRRLPDLPVRVDVIAIDRGPDGRPSIRHHRGIDT